MTELCFLAVKTVNKTSRAIKEFALLTVNTETLEPLSDVHYRVDDPETAHSEGGTGEGELGGSLDEALAGAVPLLEGSVLAGFSVNYDWLLLRGAYMRQGIDAPRIKHSLEVRQLAWPLKLAGKIEDVDFPSVARALGIAADGDTARDRVFATHAIVKRLVQDATLGARLGALNATENSIAEKIIARLEQGREEYGPWDVNDGRDYRGEALAEALDGFIYCAAGLVASEDGARETAPASEPNGETS